MLARCQCKFLNVNFNIKVLSYNMDVINDNTLTGTIKPKQIESISGCICPKCKAPRREPFFFFDDSDDDSYNEVDYWFHRRDSDEADYVDDYADYEDVADFEDDADALFAPEQSSADSAPPCSSSGKSRIPSCLVAIQTQSP